MRAEHRAGMPEKIKIRPEAEEASDAALMQRIASGEEAALRLLMQRHLPKTVRMAQRVCGSLAMAEDVAQEAFIRVWKNATKWKDPDQAGAKFTTWLYRIVLNLCIDEKRKDRFTGLDDTLPESADPGRNAEEMIAVREQSARVKAALNDLPERQKAAFVLCFYEGYSNKEAAELLGVGVKAIESLLVRSRRTLRDALKDERSGM